CHEYLKKEKLELESSSLHNFIHYLLTATNNEDYKQILRYGRILGLNFNENTNRVIMLLEIDGGAEARPEEKAWEVFQNNILKTIKAHLYENNEDIVSFLNLDQFIIIKTIGIDSKQTIDLRLLDSKVKRLKSDLKFNYNLDVHLSSGR